MDPQTVAAQFELATSFDQRQKLAADTAQAASAEQLKSLVPLLGHAVEDVRLGIIETILAARFRPALRHLAAVTVQREGQERVFAARALAQLAEPGDRALLEPLARAWLATGDPFLETHGGAVLTAVGVIGDPADAARFALAKPAPRPSQPPGQGITSNDEATRKAAIANTLAHADAPEPLFVDALLERTHKPGVRLDLVTALERLGAARFVDPALTLLNKTDGSIVTLVARALSRLMTDVPESRVAALTDALDLTYRRLYSDKLARQAIDECVLLRPGKDSEALAGRADRVTPEVARTLAMRLAGASQAKQLSQMPDLLAALARAPRRTLLFSELLRAIWPQLRPRLKQEVRLLLHRAAVSPLPGGIAPDDLASIGQLYALAQEPGGVVPTHVLDALDRQTAVGCGLAAIAIHQATATEDAAWRLATYRDEPARELREAAVAALRAFSSREVRVVFGDDGSISIDKSGASDDG